MGRVRASKEKENEIGRERRGDKIGRPEGETSDDEGSRRERKRQEPYG